MNTIIAVFALFIVSYAEIQESPTAHTIPCTQDMECLGYCINRCDVPAFQIRSYPQCYFQQCACVLVNGTTYEANHNKENKSLDPFYMKCLNHSQCDQFCLERCARRASENSTGVCDNLSTTYGGHCMCRIEDLADKIHDTEPIDRPPYHKKEDGNLTASLYCDKDGDCTHYCQSRCDLTTTGANETSFPRCFFNECSCILSNRSDIYNGMRCDNSEMCKNMCKLRCDRRMRESSIGMCEYTVLGGTLHTGWCYCRLKDQMTVQDVSDVEELPSSDGLTCKQDQDCEFSCMNRCAMPAYHLNIYPECRNEQCLCGLVNETIRQLNEISGGIHGPFQSCFKPDDCDDYCLARCSRRQSENSTGICLDTHKTFGGYCVCRIENLRDKINEIEPIYRPPMHDKKRFPAWITYSVDCTRSEDCAVFCLNRCDIDGDINPTYALCVNDSCSCILSNRSADNGYSCSDNTECQSKCKSRCDRRADEVSNGSCVWQPHLSEGSGWCYCHLYDNIHFDDGILKKTNDRPRFDDFRPDSYFKNLHLPYRVWYSTAADPKFSFTTGRPHWYADYLTSTQKPNAE